MNQKHQIHTYKDSPIHFPAFFAFPAALVCLVVSRFADNGQKWKDAFIYFCILGVIFVLASMHSKIFNRDAIINEVLTKALTAKIQLFQKEGKYVGMDAYHMALQILEKDALRGTRDLEDLNLIPILYEEFGDGL